MLYKDVECYVLYRNVRTVEIWTKGKLKQDYKYFGTLGVQSCFIVLATECYAGSKYAYFKILTSQGIFWTASYITNNANWFAEKVT